MKFEVMAPDSKRRVELALEDIRAGKMVILVDDEDRENAVFCEKECHSTLLDFVCNVCNDFIVDLYFLYLAVEIEGNQKSNDSCSCCYQWYIVHHSVHLCFARPKNPS